MEFWIKAGQLVLSLSILIALHELGHFIPAKLFKTRVEKFYLFFNPWFSLFKVKKGETEYGLGWLPLGGYVKISGMVDESMDKEQMAKPPEPWEFRSKPTWQRLIIMLGGVVVNFILGYIIYIMVLFVWGREYMPVENATYGVHCDSLLYDYGMQEGDKVLMVGGVVPEHFGLISKEILINDARTITVDRNGEQVVVPFPEDFDQVLLENGIKNLFELRYPYVVDTVLQGYPAYDAGLQSGDSLVAINDMSTLYWLDVRRQIKSHKGQELTLQFYRNGALMSLNVTPNENGQIGVMEKSAKHFLTYKKIEYGFLEAIPAGLEFGTNTLVDYVHSLKLIFTPQGVNQLGGFGAIGSMFAPVWDWHSFWMLTAFISIILAFMNILPIPALDGGHVLFLLFEMVSGKQPSTKFLERAQMVGMVILIALVLYANGNDIVKAITG